MDVAAKEAEAAHNFGGGVPRVEWVKQPISKRKNGFAKTPSAVSLLPPVRLR